VVVRRLASAGIEWWLATSDRPADSVTAAWGEDLGLEVWRGDEQDVLSRFIGIAGAAQPDWVVRATADDPFTDGAIVPALVEAAARAPASIGPIGDTPRSRQFPLGTHPRW
jgi:spore coat polysaccharide biosynthesis protein SpsF (cytidylyltransferase family)